MPRIGDGNEPHFIPRAVDQVDEAIVGGPADNPAVYSPYNLTEICTGGFDQRVLGRLIMGTLISHFIDADNIVDTYVKPYVWTSDADTTAIEIELSTRFDNRTAGRKPSIRVKRGPLRIERVAMGDFYLMENGRNRYGRLASGSYLVIVESQADGLCERIADEVFFMLNAQLTFLRERWDIPMLEVTAMGAQDPAPELADHLFKVPIQVDYQYEFGWEKCDGTDPDAITFNVAVNAQLQGD